MDALATHDAVHGEIGPRGDAVRDALGSDRLRRLYDYWRRLAGPRPFPRRREIDPLEIPFAIGRTSLVEVVPGPTRRYRFAIWSHNNLVRTGVEMTGKWLDDYPEPENREMLRRSYEEVVEARAPRTRWREPAIQGRKRPYEAVLLPLGGEAVEAILVGVIFADE